jgi:hypothetical protein
MATMPPKDEPNAPLASSLQPQTKKKLPNKSAAKNQQPTNRPVWIASKATQPHGTSPMKTNKEINNDTSSTGSAIMSIYANSTVKSNPKESNNDSSRDSLSNFIASARKTLFNCTPPAQDDDITMAIACSKKWFPIWKTAEKDNSAVHGTSSLQKGTTFAVGENFREREAPPAKKTPSMEEELAEMIKECVVKIGIKVAPGAVDVQETVLVLLEYCLPVLHKQDKMACFVNAAKTLEAFKLTDFPRAFTDFHDDWGKWGEPIKSFLNTLPQDKGRLFTGSFYFRREWD